MQAARDKSNANQKDGDEEDDDEDEDDEEDDAEAPKAGDRMAASYINFYICNGGVVMPALGQEPADSRYPAQLPLSGIHLPELWDSLNKFYVSMGL